MKQAIITTAIPYTKQRLLGHIIQNHHHKAYLKYSLETGSLLAVNLSTIFTPLEIETLLSKLTALQELGFGPLSEWYT